MSNLTVITGTSRSQRADHIDAVLKQAGDHALLVLPGRVEVRARQESLIREGIVAGGIWGDRVLDLAGLAEAILCETPAPVRRVNKLERRLLVERAIHVERETLVELLGVDPADMPGLASHFLAVIIDLKQAGIEPEVFSEKLRRSGSIRPVDVALEKVYARYQASLKERNRYDVPGLYWAAEAACDAGTPRALQGVDTILLDGFDDFTPSEMRFLKALSRHVKEVVVGLHHDARPSRIDAYSVSANALSELRRHFELSHLQLDEPEPVDGPGCVAGCLFGRDKLPESQRITKGLAVVPCIDARHEAETVVRDIRRLLRDGASTSEIVIVLRDGGESLLALRAALSESGIPFRSTLREALSSTCPATCLLAFVDMLADWEREKVLEALGDAHLWPDRPLEDVEAFGLLARKAMVLAGEQEWHRQLEGLGRGLAGNSRAIRQLRARLPHAERALTEMKERLAQLREWARSIPEEAPLAAYIEAMEGIISRWSFTQPEDDSALTALWNMLHAWTSMAGEQPISRDGFTRALGQALSEVEVSAASGPQGVLIAQPEFLRNRRFRHVFVLGVNEGIYPRPPAMNALYGRRDRERSRGAGIPLEDAVSSATRERLMFLRLFLDAENSVTLSWRIQKEQGREASRSPFLIEIEEHLGREISRPVPSAESVLPAAADAYSIRDLAAVAAHAGDRAFKALASRFPEVERASAAEEDRWAEAPCGTYDGVLLESANLERLAAEFGSEHTFSAAQLETWLACPFQFLQQRLLQLDESDPFEGEFDPRTRGTVLHAALQQFHASHAGKTLGELDLESARAELAQALNDVINQRAHHLASLPDEVVAAEQAYLTTRLMKYLAGAMLRDGDTWRPSLFEVGFGHPPKDDGIEPEAQHPAYALTLLDGDKVLFSGRIDRIDLNKNGDAACILDYKSGSAPSARSIYSGMDIQLGLYALALGQVVMPGLTCAEAYYVPVGKDKWQDALGNDAKQKKEDWAKRDETMRLSIGNAVTAIREGHFPPLPNAKTCYGCGHARACRRTDARQARKTDTYRNVSPPPEEEFE